MEVKNSLLPFVTICAKVSSQASTTKKYPYCFSLIPLRAALALITLLN